MKSQSSAKNVTYDKISVELNCYSSIERYSSKTNALYGKSLIDAKNLYFKILPVLAKGIFERHTIVKHEVIKFPAGCEILSKN